MKIKKGFTLVELMVAIACSSIVLVGLFGAFSFLLTQQNRAVSIAEDTYQLPAIRDYICKNNITSDAELTITDGTITHNGSILASDTEITAIIFTSPAENGTPFTLCRILGKGPAYEFIVGYTS